MFQPYRRSRITELRPYKLGEPILSENIRLSLTDAAAGSPKEGDMIARDPANPAEQWLVSAADFARDYVSVPELTRSSPVVRRAPSDDPGSGIRKFRGSSKAGSVIRLSSICNTGVPLRR